jgi:hypothetical protein
MKNHFLVFVLLVSSAAYSSVLTESESLEFARTCIKAVIENPCSEIADSLENKQYGSSKILEIDSSGATILAHVRIVYQCKSGTNKGWGQPVFVEYDRTYKCLTGNVAKGEYPIPHAFAKRESQEEEYDVYQYVERTPRGPKSTWGILRQSKIYEHVTSIEAFDYLIKNDYPSTWSFQAPGIFLTRKHFSKYLEQSGNKLPSFHQK